jgi:multidrug resistance efflux pump
VTDTAEILDTNHVVAFFPPEALLQIKSGQEASLQLNDFPQEEYGSVTATVEKVIEHLQDGRTRVELQLSNTTASIIPFQAGLKGRVEIKVDQVPPLTLLLRTTGLRTSNIFNASGANSN